LKKIGYLLEFARATSLVSLGSIQTRLFPHFNTAAASLFWSLKNAIYLYTSKFNNDKFNVLCGVVELFLLSKCNRYIIGTADSTFSVSAMIMADKETQKYLFNDVSNLPEF
jgi:hypothetical protein